MKQKLLALVLLLALLPGVSFADGLVSLTPALKFGLSTFKQISIVNTPVAIKTTFGNVYGWHLYNAAASARFFKFYKATTANVTVGTTVPDLTIPIPAGAAANVEFSNGITFPNAITIACTTGVADNDNGAPTANDCTANVFFK